MSRTNLTINLDPRQNPTLKVEEVCQLLDISRPTYYRAVKRGDIPTIQVGRLIKVPTAGILRMLQIDTTTDEVEGVDDHVQLLKQTA